MSAGDARAAGATGTDRTAPAWPAVLDRRGVLLAAALAVVIFAWSFAAYWPALSADFVDFDDRVLIVENTEYRGFEPENLRWMFTSTLMGHYQPLTWLSYAADYALSNHRPDYEQGLDPRQFHLTNLLLHAANAVLVFLVSLHLLAAMRGAAPGAAAGDEARAGPMLRILTAAAAALLWAVHPLRVESVAWATERRDVLSGFFLLLSLLAYLRSVSPGRAELRSSRLYAACIGLLLLSLLSKAWGMSFFVVVLILDWYPLRRLPISPLEWLRPVHGRVLAQKIPLVVLGVACAAAAAYAQGSVSASRSLGEWDLPSRIAQALQGLLWYPAKTLWPTRLIALYELPRSLDPLAPKFLMCGAILAAIGAGLWTVRRRWPGLVAAAAVYAVVISPVLGLSQAGDQLVADRYSYLAVIGLTIVAAAGLGFAARRRALRFPLAAGVLSVLGTMTAMTWTQTRVWKDEVSLWSHAVRVRPELMMPHISLGGKLEHAGDLGGAIEQYREATRVRPDDGRGWYPLANALKKKRDFAGAERAYIESAKSIPQAYLPLINLGNMLINDLGRVEDGIIAYREAVANVENPPPGGWVHPGPYLSLGAALKKHGDPAEARRMLEKAERIASENPKKYGFILEQARGHLQQMGVRPAGR